MGSSPIQVAICGNSFASVAQLVEQRTENPRVVGSIPTGGTSGTIWSRSYADLAHLVERDLAKVEVAGSSPVIRSKKTRSSERVFFICVRRTQHHLTEGQHHFEQSENIITHLCGHKMMLCFSQMLWAYVK